MTRHRWKESIKVNVEVKDKVPLCLTKEFSTQKIFNI
jgi:hypothetical protein